MVAFAVLSISKTTVCLPRARNMVYSLCHSSRSGNEAQNLGYGDRMRRQGLIMICLTPGSSAWGWSGPDSGCLALVTAVSEWLDSRRGFFWGPLISSNLGP